MTQLDRLAEVAASEGFLFRTSSDGTVEMVADQHDECRPAMMDRVLTLPSVEGAICWLRGWQLCRKTSAEMAGFREWWKTQRKDLGT